jgi:hypothetical protein
MNSIANPKNSCTEECVIFFINPKSNQMIFLASTANIDDICYSTTPTLPGTVDYFGAKRYKNIEEAKSDIYKLRYHHREFLKIKLGIKRISKEELEINNILVFNSSLQ